MNLVPPQNRFIRIEYHIIPQISFCLIQEEIFTYCDSLLSLQRHSYMHLDCGNGVWTIFFIKKGQADNLTQHTVSIKFMYEEEKEGKIPFLDTLIVRKDDRTVKLLVYRKSTHMDPISPV